MPALDAVSPLRARVAILEIQLAQAEAQLREWDEVCESVGVQSCLPEDLVDTLTRRGHIAGALEAIRYLTEQGALVYADQVW